MINDIFIFLGKLITIGGGLVGMAYLFFRFLGSKWIDSKFAKSLEEYKALQAKDLEETKSKISLLLSRKLKLHDKEFEVLPEVWGKLNDAKVALEQCVIAFREMPDLNRMDQDHLKRFFERSELSDDEVIAINESSDKNKEYSRILEWKDIVRANKHFIDFHNYLQRVRIFLSPDIKEKFDKIDDHIWGAWVSKKVSRGSNNLELEIKAYETVQNSIKPLMKEIEELVQSKLFPV